MEVEYEELFGTRMAVVTMDGKQYLIGLEVAHLLNRETFNLYRSMKMRKIEIIRATPTQIDALVELGATRSGTRSVTFVGYEKTTIFISEVRGKRSSNVHFPEEPKKRGVVTRSAKLAKHRDEEIELNPTDNSYNYHGVPQTTDHSAISLSGSDTPVEFYQQVDPHYPTFNNSNVYSPQYYRTTAYSTAPNVDQRQLYDYQREQSFPPETVSYPVSYYLPAEPSCKFEPQGAVNSEEVEQWIDSAVLDCMLMSDMSG